MTSYGERLAAVTASRGRLCVGIDPHRSVIEAWGFEYGIAGPRGGRARHGRRTR